MLNQILFGIIGLIMLSIAGIGAVAVVKNPEAAKEIPATAISVVKEAVSTVVPGNRDVSKNSADTEDENEAEDDNDDDDGAQAGSAGGTTGGTAGQANGTNPPASTSGGITMVEVAKHNSATSCYTAINGGVYDVTAWINQHPGGKAAILSLCGIGGSAAFNDQHGGQRRPEQELASFKIGTLAQ